MVLHTYNVGIPSMRVPQRSTKSKPRFRLLTLTFLPNVVAVLLWLGVLQGRPAAAASLEIRYGALERFVAAQVFTTEGRRYVGDTQNEKCRFAYLERPKFGPSGSRLLLRVHFTGKYALGMFGKCVGMGDAFDLEISALPVAKNGAIAFEQWSVSTPRDSFYIRRVRAALLQSISKDFKIEVRDQAKQMLEAPGKGDFQQDLKEFNLSAVRVTADALVLEVDFKLVVK